MLWSAELPVDEMRFAHDPVLILPRVHVSLAQRMHDLEILQRCIGRLHRLESERRLDQPFQLAVVGLDDVVEILHLSVRGCLRTLALRFQLGNRDTVKSGPLSVLIFRSFSQPSTRQEPCPGNASRPYGVAGCR